MCLNVQYKSVNLCKLLSCSVGNEIMKIHFKKSTKNLSLGYQKRQTALGFNILSSQEAATTFAVAEDSMMLKRFLDFLWNDAKKKPLNLVSYTSETDAGISALTEGVEID